MTLAQCQPARPSVTLKRYADRIVGVRVPRGSVGAGGLVGATV